LCTRHAKLQGNLMTVKHAHARTSPSSSAVWPFRLAPFTPRSRSPGATHSAPSRPGAVRVTTTSHTAAGHVRSGDPAPRAGDAAPRLVLTANSMPVGCWHRVMDTSSARELLCTQATDTLGTSPGGTGLRWGRGPGAWCVWCMRQGGHTLCHGRVALRSGPPGPAACSQQRETLPHRLLRKVRYTALRRRVHGSCVFFRECDNVGARCPLGACTTHRSVVVTSTLSAAMA
jgi:hypothetical protein